MEQRRKKLNLFESATLRLTAWYMTLLMVVSLLFSTVLYEVGVNEIHRAVGPGEDSAVTLFVRNDTTMILRQQRILHESSGRIIASLIVFNLAVFVGGGVLSYLLARRTLQPIKAAHEAQSRFASDAAHELRTPLAVMQTEIEVNLRDKNTTAVRQRAVLESTLEELSRLRTLTDRLLQLASQQELPISDVDIESAAVDALTHAVPLAQSKGIKIDNQIGEGTVKGHVESVTDILSILIDNAIKYSPKKSKITLVSTSTGHSVSLQVRDEGPGISVNEQAKIFERFYRSDTSRSKANIEGHGLGLSLAKRLADEMHGSLTVQSDGKSGSTFMLTLPK